MTLVKRSFLAQLGLSIFALVLVPFSFESAVVGQDKAAEIKGKNEKIAKMLESSNSVFAFDEVPWGDIQGSLEEHYKVKISLDPSAINDSLLSDTPITFKSSGIKIRNALTLMLSRHNSTYFVRDGVLVICSLDDVEKIGTKESAEAKKKRLEIDAVDNAWVARRIKKPFKADFNETPWETIEEELERKFGVNIFLDESAIDDYLPPDESITFKSDATSLNEILATKNATLVIRNQVVMIVSQDSEFAEEAKKWQAKLAVPEPSVKVAEDKISFDYSSNWEKVKPANRIVEAELKIPRVGEDEQDGRLTIMGAGGSIEANIQRWQGQFSGAEAKSHKLFENTTLVDIEGTYMDAPGGPFSGKPKIERKNYRMLAAIIQTKNGNYFVKLYGPKATISKNESLFHEMIESVEIEK